MSNFHNLIPSFAPVTIRAMDNFSNVLSTVNTIDELNDWLYEEKTCYFSYSEAAAFAKLFIERFNVMMRFKYDYLEFSFGPEDFSTVYIINKL